MIPKQVSSKEIPIPDIPIPVNAKHAVPGPACIFKLFIAQNGEPEA